MNLFKLLLYSLQEGDVRQPPFAASQVIAHGIEVVSASIKAKKIQDAIAERRQEEEWRRLQAKREESPGTRYKTDVVRPREPQTIPVVNHGRRPPNLHARVLSFSARLVKYVHEKCDGKAPIAYKRAGLDRKLYSRIVSDDSSTVSKLTALQLAIGLQLDRSETDEFIRAAGYAFSETIPLDCAFAYCIENRVWNIHDVNRILVGAGLPALNISM